MSPINWDKRYDTGIEPIDEQHRQLVALINILEKVIHGNVENEEERSKMLSKVMEELVSYTKNHFHYEEQLMRASSYPKFVEHKHSHDHMTDKIMEYKKKLEEKHLDCDHLYNLLSTWLTNHIQHSDQDYISFVESSVERHKQIKINEARAREVEELKKKASENE